jgi:hypothetical protein
MVAPDKGRSTFDALDKVEQYATDPSSLANSVHDAPRCAAPARMVDDQAFDVF